jgi:hypothetical protein
MRTEAGNGAVFMAGGIDLVNRMKFGEPVAEVIYLGGRRSLKKKTRQRPPRRGNIVTHYQLGHPRSSANAFPHGGNLAGCCQHHIPRARRQHHDCRSSL